MASKKQVRRREKLRRHEYEEVYVDADGNVVEPPEEEPRPDAKASRNGKRQGSGRAASRSGRIVQPPSWKRVGKRTLIFAPLLYIAITLFPGGNKLSVLERVVTTLWYLALLIPFMYLMDRLTYRLWLRRTGQSGAGKRTSHQ